MAKITLDTTLSGYRSTSVVNANNDLIEAEFNDKVLYRDNPTGEANQMESVLDMNSNRVINLPSPSSDSEPARWVDVRDGVIGVNEAIPAFAGNEGRSLTTDGVGLVYQTAALDVKIQPTFAALIAAHAATPYVDGDTVTITGSGIYGDGVIVVSASHGLTSTSGVKVVLDNNTYWERSLLSGVVLTSWWGDQTAANIQAALDYAASDTVLNPTSGEITTRGYTIEVRMPGKTQTTISDSIRITEQHNGIWFNLNDSTIVRDSTAGTTAYALSLIGTNNWELACNYVTVSNGKLKGSGATSHGLYLQNAQYNNFVNILIDDFDAQTKFAGAYGLYLANDSWSNEFKSVTVNRSFNSLFVGEKCNTNVFYQFRSEFCQQYALQTVKNTNTCFIVCQFEFSGLDDSNVIMSSAIADIDYSVYVRANNNNFYGCRFDGNVGKLRVHGFSGDTFWDYVVGTTFEDPFFTTNDTYPDTWAVEIDRAADTIIKGPKGYKINGNNNYTSALIRLETNSLRTQVIDPRVISTDPSTPSPGGDLLTLSIASGVTSYTLKNHDVFTSIAEIRSESDKVLDFYGLRTAAGGTAVRWYTKNAAGTNTIRAQISGSIDESNFRFLEGCVPILPTHTVAGLPTPSLNTRGVIWVSDETGGATMAFSDGTNWRRVQDRAIVS